MSVRQRGKSWQVQINNGSERHRLSFSTEAEAQKWETVALAALKAGEPLPSKDITDSGLTLRSFLKSQFQVLWGDISHPLVVEQNFSVIFDHLDPDTPLVDLDEKSLAEMCASMLRGNELREPISGPTVNRKTTNLRKLLKRAKRLKLIPEVPEMDSFKEGAGRDRVITPHELSAMRALHHISGTQGYRHLLDLLVNTGMRLSEPFKLNAGQVTKTRDGYYEIIPRIKNTKSGLPRLIPLTQDAQEALLALMKSEGVEPGDEAPIIQSFSQRQFYDNWSRKLRPMLDLEDDKEFVPHALRHTFITNMAPQIGLTLVGQMAGHSNIETTKKYKHLNDSALRMAIRALHSG